ncbi:hypothetical protein HK405_014596 [Cladochytrium tenue]|nr:hypothetical protein HK405_014596 [Cladochytrium tenue]
MPTYATTSATKAIQKELRALMQVQAEVPAADRGWIIESDSIINLYVWRVRLVEIDKSIPLGRDLLAHGLYEQGLKLELRFGPEFPFAPPYVRVVSPRLLPLAEGGGGHVTAGGSLCMDLLTLSGWSPSYSLEATLVQLRATLCAAEPRPARLDAARLGRDYGSAEALSGYMRAAAAHSWRAPEGLAKYAG